MKQMGHLVAHLLPRTRRARRWTVVLVVSLALLGAGGAALAATRGSGNGTTSVTATASSGTMRQTVSATGTIAPKHEADLNFAVAGTVRSVPATVGAKVKQGDVLARVDRGALRIDLQAARAAVTAAKSQLSGDVSGGAAVAQIRSDEANLSSMRSSRASAKQALADATLRSTITGTIASVDLAVGDQVSGAPSNGSTDAAATASQIVVISTDEFVVNASVGASDLASLKKGLQAEIIPTGATEAIFGTVSSVGLVAETSTSGSSTFPVVIDVTGKVSGVYAGSSAGVSIIVKQQQNVLTVPSAAITSSNGKTTVIVVKNGKRQTRAVTLGVVYGPQTQITKGLSAGEQVLVTTVRLPSSTNGGTGGTGGFGRGGGGFGGGGGGFGTGQGSTGVKPGSTSGGAVDGTSSK
jgi:multidrug efflux pump subunit AcrA (membrane-fusion protein)